MQQEQVLSQLDVFLFCFVGIRTSRKNGTKGFGKSFIKHHSILWVATGRCHMADVAILFFLLKGLPFRNVFRGLFSSWTPGTNPVNPMRTSVDFMLF